MGTRRVRAGLLLVALACCALAQRPASADCNPCDNCQCKMVNAYCQFSTKMPGTVSAAWSFWTYTTDGMGNRTYTAAQNASGGGGLLTCGCPNPDNMGKPTITSPAVTIQRYQLNLTTDKYTLVCSVANKTFAEITVSPPPQNATLTNWTQYTCKQAGG